MPWIDVKQIIGTNISAATAYFQLPKLVAFQAFINGDLNMLRNCCLLLYLIPIAVVGRLMFYSLLNIKFWLFQLDFFAAVVCSAVTIVVVQLIGYGTLLAWGVYATLIVGAIGLSLQAINAIKKKRMLSNESK